MKVLIELLKEINSIEEKLLANHPNSSVKIAEIMDEWRVLILNKQEAKK